jgi:hypothetical protein
MDMIFKSEQLEADELFQRNLNFGSVYFDIQNIAAKMYHNGYFENFVKLLKGLHKEESDFTAKELRKIIEENRVGMDIEREFLSNAVIFKNNLKVILAKLIDDIWETSPLCLKEFSMSNIVKNRANGSNVDDQECIDDGDILVEKQDSDNEKPEISNNSIQNAYNSARNKMAENLVQKDPTTCKKSFSKSKYSAVENKTSAHKPTPKGSSLSRNKFSGEMICKPVRNLPTSTREILNINQNIQQSLKSKNLTLPSKQLQDCTNAEKDLNTSHSFVLARRGCTGERKPLHENAEANKIAKLIGEKNKDLDSEFLHSNKAPTFSRAKRDFQFAVPEGPGPSKFVAKSDSLNFIKRNVYTGIKFGKAEKRYFEDEAPKTDTPGPAYNGRRTYCS